MPTNLIELPEVKPDAPSELAEVADNQVSTPTDLTELSQLTPNAPDDLTEVANNAPNAPDELTEVAQLTPNAPDNLTEVANSAPTAPSNVSGIAENLFTYSEQFNNADWTKTDSSVLSNALASPDGNVTADRLQASSTASLAPRASQTLTLEANTTYTISVWARRSSVTFLQMYFGSSDIAGDPFVNFDLTNGAVGNSDGGTAGITAAITGAVNVAGAIYYRCSMTFTTDSTTSVAALIQLIRTDVVTRAASESYTSGDGLFLWGAQLNRGGIAPYILSVADPAVGTLVDAPLELTEVATNAPIAPTELTEVAQLTPNAPDELTEVANNQVPIPVELTEVAQVTPSAPSELTEVAESTPIAPSQLTLVAEAIINRTIEAIIDFDFGNGLYAINGEPTTIAESLTYSRNDTATFWDRRLNERGEWETFLNTDYVGSVTNLLTYSEDFADPDWGKNRSSVEFSQQENAFKFIEDGTASDTHNMGQIVSWTSGNTYTLSAKVKAGSGRRAYLYLPPAAFPAQCVALFDLEAGQIANDGVMGDGAKEFSIVYEGDGFYRISVTGVCDTTTSSSCNLFLADENATTYSGDSESFIYVTEFQLTESNKVLPYVQTTAISASQTFTESPRIEVDPVTAEILGYLSEIQATNRVANSEDSSNWGSQNVTVTPNYDRAPDGTLSATLMTDDATNGTHQIFDSISGGALNTQYTVSAYIKSINLRYAWVYGQSSLFANRAQALFDLETGEVVSGSGASFGNYTFNDARIVDCGDGWYRCCVTFTSSNTATEEFNTVAVCGDINEDASTAYVGTSQSFLVWGLQAENSPYATSYIPNSSGGTTTRVRDELNGNGSLVPTVLEKQTYFVEAKVNFDNVFNGANPKTFWGTDDDPRYFRINTGNNLEVRHGSGAATGNLSAFDTTEMTKYAGVINDNITTYRNGVQLGFQSSLSGLDNTVNDLFGIGHAAHTTTQNCDGHIRKIQLYDTNLTPAEVASL